MPPIYKRILTLVAIVGLLALLCAVYFAYNPVEHPYFLVCPFRALTGYHCPGCGSQRAIHQLLHGELYLAFRLNPLMILSLPLIMFGLGTKIYNYVFQTGYRVMLFYKSWFIYGYFGAAILYWILRNIPYAPFHYLAPIDSLDL